MHKRTSPTILEQAKIAVPEFENVINKIYQFCFKMIDKEILKLLFFMPILQQHKHT
jgi:hypothetical protein